MEISTITNYEIREAQIVMKIKPSRRLCELLNSKRKNRHPIKVGSVITVRGELSEWMENKNEIRTKVKIRDVSIVFNVVISVHTGLGELDY